MPKARPTCPQGLRTRTLASVDPWGLWPQLSKLSVRIKKQVRGGCWGKQVGPASSVQGLALQMWGLG